jgi:hypothetical protein
MLDWLRASSAQHAVGWRHSKASRSILVSDSTVAAAARGRHMQHVFAGQPSGVARCRAGALQGTASSCLSAHHRRLRACGNMRFCMSGVLHSVAACQGCLPSGDVGQLSATAAALVVGRACAAWMQTPALIVGAGCCFACTHYSSCSPEGSGVHRGHVHD